MALDLRWKKGVTLQLQVKKDKGKVKFPLILFTYTKFFKYFVHSLFTD